MYALLTLTVFLCGAPEATPTPPAPFAAARFREHVAYLASDELAGRAVGSPGATKALDYMTRHLKEYGAAGLGQGGAWLQDFPYATEVVAKTENSLVVNDGPAFALGREFTLAPESPDGTWEAEMVFAGYGVTVPKLDYDDFVSVDLQGKVAVVLAGLSSALAKAEVPDDVFRKLGECQRRGAVALLIIQPKNRPHFRTDWRLRAE